MKKYLLGIFATAIAIAGVAFTKPPASEKLIDYVWYQIPSSGSCGTYTQTQYVYTGESSRPTATPASSAPYGCPNAGTFCCAKGYLSADLEPQSIGGTQYWMPKANAIPVDINKLVP